MTIKTATELHEMLLKSSKEELIELIMKAAELTFATFPWIELLGKAKLIVTERKMETVRVNGEALRKELLAIPKSKCTASNQEALKLICDIKRNNYEYMKLLQKTIKLKKQIYG